MNTAAQYDTNQYLYSSNNNNVASVYQRNDYSQLKLGDYNSNISNTPYIERTNKYGMPEEKEKEPNKSKGNNSYRVPTLSSSPQYSSDTNNAYKPSNTISYKPKITYPPDVTKISHNRRGLHNIGNTCYMNTCLQNLMHSIPFIHKLVNHYPYAKGNKPITSKFYSLCKEQTSGVSFPRDFLSAFRRNHYTYNGYPQHDTQEFCRLLLEDMSNELNTAENKKYYKEIKTKGKSKQQIKEEFQTVFRKRESSIIIDTFYSQFITSFQCLNEHGCGYVDYSCQNMLDIPLRFPVSRSTPTPGRNLTYGRLHSFVPHNISLETSHSLYSLLDEFFEQEIIDFALKCEKCKQKTKHKKITKISQLPEILILSLQRFSHDYSSVNRAQVTFESDLDLSKYVDDDDGYLKQTPALYKLYGISNHTGSFNFGHYYAYIKVKEDWYEFNDSHVYHHRLSFSSTTAYILFYQRIDTTET